ncbi:MAG: hypothetical protein NZ960_06570 [Candidatus Kapabacteria bacterium]|nr:hypothetical protein [Candidatus Kapabacteria bacterium]MDW8012761.1 hypothetical protein [Bacteroidota bacterium]
MPLSSSSASAIRDRGYIFQRCLALCGIAGIVFQHHERLGGLGFPRYLRGCQIRAEAAVVAPVDIFCKRLLTAT